MNAIDQQIEIAESQGYQHVRSIYDITGMLVGWREDADPKICKLPNYTGCLNAMHEVERSLDDVIAVIYVKNLAELVRPAENEEDAVFFQSSEWTLNMVAATASQRAEAYLRTINKWKD